MTLEKLAAAAETKAKAAKAAWAEGAEAWTKAEEAVAAEVKIRYLPESKTPAEDLWMAILAAQGKMEEAKECFLDLSEMAWELVLAEQKRTKEKPQMLPEEADAEMLYIAWSLANAAEKESAAKMRAETDMLWKAHEKAENLADAARALANKEKLK